MRILVTGGGGFIGSNFIFYLLKKYKKDVDIINVDALTYAGNLTTLKSIENHRNYHFNKIRIENREEMEKLCKQAPPDYIINFAAESHVDRSIKDATPFIATNILGTQTLLDLSLKYKIKRYIQISTDEVYGELGTSGKFTEDTPLAPNSPYSASKASADLLVRSYVKTHGLNAVITRCSNNYGPYQYPEKLIPLMIINALNDKSLPIYGKGHNIRDWIHVEDHCRGIDQALHLGKQGEIYNLGGESEKTNLDVVHNILKKINKPTSLIKHVNDRHGHDFRYAINIEKSRKELNWEPQVEFTEGLEKTIDWYLENETWWKEIQRKNHHHLDD